MWSASRRSWLGTILAALGLAASAQPAPVAVPRPNILLILADDLGYGDLSSYGRPDYRTPHLDRLAREGVRFTHAYAAAPLCTPTRCALMTGRYPARTPVGLVEPIRAGKDEVGLPPEHPTLASLLKASGYETALVGKWHLGFRPQDHPNRHGFDEFFGITSGGVDYFGHYDGRGSPDLFLNQTPIERAGYLTELLTARAREFLSRPREKPFYLSLHYTAPHWPWQTPRRPTLTPIVEGRKESENLGRGGSLTTYAEMMKSLDDGVGQVLEALAASGRERETLVIFTSDNGGERFSYNWPFRGEKGELWEGGLRVPAIVRWPGVVPDGRVVDQVAITMDWTATLLAVAGSASDPAYPLDGVDLLPVMTGAAPVLERTLFWRYGESETAIRAGHFKHLKDAQGEEYLFDLEDDEREAVDLREDRPEVFERLKAAFARWDAEMLPRRPR